MGIFFIKQELPKVKHVQVNYDKRCVTAVFSDNTHEIVKCSESDDFDPKIGLALAIVYHFYGSKSRFSKLLKESVVIKSDIKKETSLRDLLKDFREKHAKEIKSILQETSIYYSLWKNWEDGALPRSISKNQLRIEELSKILNVDSSYIYELIQKEKKKRNEKHD